MVKVAQLLLLVDDKKKLIQKKLIYIFFCLDLLHISFDLLLPSYTFSSNMSEAYVKSLTQQHSQKILEHQKQKQRHQATLKPAVVVEATQPTPTPPPPPAPLVPVKDIAERVAEFDFIRYDQIGFGDVNTQYQRNPNRKLPHPLDDTNFHNGYTAPSFVSRLLQPPVGAETEGDSDSEPADDNFADSQHVYQELDAIMPACEPCEPVENEIEADEDEANRPRSPFWNSVELVHDDVVAEQQRKQHEQLLRLSQNQVPPDAYQKRLIDQITNLRKLDEKTKKR